VRKKLGLTLVSEKTGAERVYSIELEKPPRKSNRRRRAARNEFRDRAPDRQNDRGARFRVNSDAA
jgi:hypothetical protein